MITFCVLISRLGKLRFSRFYDERSIDARQKTIAHLTREVLNRPIHGCTVLETAFARFVFRRYASLYFVIGIDDDENVLTVIDFVQNLVETLDSYFENVCELDLVYNFIPLYYLMDEIIVQGSIFEIDKQALLDFIAQQDAVIQKCYNAHQTTGESYVSRTKSL